MSFGFGRSITKSRILNEGCKRTVVLENLLLEDDERRWVGEDAIVGFGTKNFGVFGFRVY